MRISGIFKKELGLVKKRLMIDGEQKNRWVISDEKKKQLQKQHAQKSYDPEEELEKF